MRIYFLRVRATGLLVREEHYGGGALYYADLRPEHIPTGWPFPLIVNSYENDHPEEVAHFRLVRTGERTEEHQPIYHDLSELEVVAYDLTEVKT